MLSWQLPPGSSHCLPGESGALLLLQMLALETGSRGCWQSCLGQNHSAGWGKAGRKGSELVGCRGPQPGPAWELAQWLLQSYSHPESPSLFTEEGTELQGSRVTPLSDAETVTRRTSLTSTAAPPFCPPYGGRTELRRQKVGSPPQGQFHTPGQSTNCVQGPHWVSESRRG